VPADCGVHLIARLVFAPSLLMNRPSTKTAVHRIFSPFCLRDFLRTRSQERRRSANEPNLMMQEVKHQARIANNQPNIIFSRLFHSRFLLQKLYVC
jgi:hypothetical protein